MNLVLVSQRAAVVVLLGLGAVVGCGDDGSASGSKRASGACDAQTGMERDRCVHDEILATPGSQPDEVKRRAGLIVDPMIRGAAVSSWVAANANALPREKGQELCDLLEGRDRSYCQRRLSSPHLQR